MDFNTFFLLSMWGDVEGLKIFMRSREEGVEVNEFSCASVLGACASLENLKVGTQVPPCHKVWTWI